MPSSSDRGWWGLMSTPGDIERPLDLDLSDDEEAARPPTPPLSEEEEARRDRARNHCERLLHTEVCPRDSYAGWRTRAWRTSTASRTR